MGLIDLCSFPCKFCRIIADRYSAAKRKAIRDMRILELEHQVEILQGQRNTLSAELPLLQVFSLHGSTYEHATYLSSDNASNRVVCICLLDCRGDAPS